MDELLTKEEAFRQIVRHGFRKRKPGESTYHIPYGDGSRKLVARYSTQELDLGTETVIESIADEEFNAG